MADSEPLAPPPPPPETAAYNEAPSGQPEWEPVGPGGRPQGDNPNQKSIQISFQLPSLKIFAVVHLLAAWTAYILWISSTTKYGGDQAVIGDGKAPYIGTLVTLGLILACSPPVLVLLDMNELPTIYLSVFGLVTLFFSFVSLAHGIKVLPDNNKIVKSCCAFLGLSTITMAGMLYAQVQAHKNQKRE